MDGECVLENWLGDLSGFIEEHRAWAGPVLGLITFGESMVLIGAFFPATALMVVAGGLVGAGILHPAPVLFYCVLGAVLGDAVSYWIGRRLGMRAVWHPLLRRHVRSMARARLFFRRYGSASIYLCRFMGPVRAFVPLIAGMTGMGHRRFQIANVGSAVVWVPVMLAPGYLGAKGADELGLLRDGHSVDLLILAGVAILVAAALSRRQIIAARARRRQRMEASEGSRST